MNKCIEEADKYIELLENLINRYENPTRFGYYMMPTDSEVVEARGRWLASRAIAKFKEEDDMPDKSVIDVERREMVDKLINSGVKLGIIPMKIK